MKRVRRWMMVALMLISAGFLVGDDCEFELEGLHWPYYDYVVYEPVPVYDFYPVYEPIYYY